MGQLAIPTKTKSKMQTIEDSGKIKFNTGTAEEAKNYKDDSNSSHYQLSQKEEEKDGKQSMRDTNPANFTSVAQTPCFAETPYTTDQFKGYKINPDPVTVPSMMQTGFSRQSRLQ